MPIEQENKKGAQVTIQVCLEKAVFLARFREMQLESETMALPEKGNLSPKGDLAMRSMIVTNVIRILQQRKAAIESDLRKLAADDLAATAKRELPYCPCSLCRIHRMAAGELERL